MMHYDWTINIIHRLLNDMNEIKKIAIFVSTLFLRSQFYIKCCIY